LLAAADHGGDILLLVAGSTVKTPSNVQRSANRQAPGTWLPIRVSRSSTELELIAKFPPE
jgi:S1-C subfamily serine protease